MKRLLLAVLAALVFTGLAAAPALASPSPASLNTAIASAIHADGGYLAWDAARKVNVMFMGDTTEIDGKSVAGAFGFPHDVIVTNVPGQASFQPQPGKGGYGWQAVPYCTPAQNWCRAADGSYFWPGGLLISGSTIYDYGARVRGVSPYTVLGSYVARFSASSLAFEGISPVGTSLALGSAVAWPGGHWLIGTEGFFPKDGYAVWVPSGDETRSAAWRFYRTLPAALNVGTVVSPFRRNGRWYAITKQGDAYNGSVLEELTAGCMAGCTWHATGKTWPTDTAAGLTYSAQADGPAGSGQEQVSYAVNGPAQYSLDFLDVTP